MRTYIVKREPGRGPWYVYLADPTDPTVPAGDVTSNPLEKGTKKRLWAPISKHSTEEAARKAAEKLNHAEQKKAGKA